jgi:beta-lactamase regulating signal transducer with metallopeptidase domain
VTLALVLLKVSAVLALALSAAALGGRRSAAWRHWVLATGIVCALLLPALALVVPAWRVITPPAPASVSVETSETIVGADAPRAQQGPAARVSPWPSWPAATVLAVLWLLGAAVGLSSLLVGARRLSRIAATAREIDGEWAGQARTISSALGLQLPVRFRETTQPALLVTWGARRAEVLLPAGAATWPAERIRIVVAHELAHVRRGDWPIQLLAEVLRVVYWFHPLAWLACRRLRQESERASDDIVLGLGIARTVYASQLVDLARTFIGRTPAPAPALAIAQPSTLQRRIRAMLNVQLDRRPLSPVSRLGGALLMLLATAPIAAIGGQAAGTVSGTVTDPTGRGIPGVSLTLVNGSLDLKVQAKTDAAGAFEVPVIAGTYQLEARHPGFAVQSQPVTLAAGEQVQRALVLQIGSLRETINVVGGGPVASSAPAAPRARPAAKECTASAAGGRIGPPMKIRDVRPIYPSGSTAAATVALEARIDVDGTVDAVRATAPVAPEFEASAIAAVREWEFTPALLNCEPVPVTMLVTVSFRADR